MPPAGRAPRPAGGVVPSAWASRPAGGAATSAWAARPLGNTVTATSAPAIVTEAKNRCFTGESPFRIARFDPRLFRVFWRPPIFFRTDKFLEQLQVHVLDTFVIQQLEIL